MNSELKKSGLQFSDMLLYFSFGLMMSILWNNRQTAVTVGAIITLLATALRIGFWLAKPASSVNEKKMP